MNEEITISRSTKSKAYLFIKSLISDGADGADVHKLVAAISDNISDDIGGTILMDLIRNKDDPGDDIKYEKYWMGPFSHQYFNWIINDWAEYCNDTELRGTFRFGDIDEWRVWNKQNSSPLSDSEVKAKSKMAMNEICVFEWWADAVATRDTTIHMRDLYKRLQQRVKEEEEK